VMGREARTMPPLPVSKGNLGVKVKRCGGKPDCYVPGKRLRISDDEKNVFLTG